MLSAAGTCVLEVAWLEEEEEGAVRAACTVCG